VAFEMGDGFLFGGARRHRGEMRRRKKTKMILLRNDGGDDWANPVLRTPIDLIVELFMGSPDRVRNADLDRHYHTGCFDEC
jgi:hypothetical protein